MKTRIIRMSLVALLLATSFTLSAQHPKQQPAKKNYRALQCEQIVQTLMLDDATAARFTPVYKQYMTEMRAVRNHASPRKAGKSATGEAAKPTTKPAVKPIPTDNEVEQAIKSRFAQSRKMLDVREKYYTEFRKILSPKQILRIYQIEKKNTAQAQKELKKRHAKKHANKKAHVSTPKNKRD